VIYLIECYNKNSPWDAQHIHKGLSNIPEQEAYAMSTTIPTSREKRDIALQYLGISARKFAEAQNDYEASLRELKTMHHYLDLALEYGCSESEMMFALGYSRQRFNRLMKQVQR
jgi:hypothetical protein